MLDTLRIVRGAVAERDLLPVLTHFYFKDGRIQGGNGRITIAAPLIAPALDGVVVPAKKFLKASDACGGMPNMKVNDEGTKLRLSKGSMRVILPLLPGDSYPVLPEVHGDATFVTELFLTILRRLKPFIGTDALKIWTCGIIFDGEYAYATNNICLVRYPCVFPACQLPAFTVDELLRIAREPATVEVGKTAVRFDLGDGVVLQTQLFEAQPPDLASFFQDEVDPPPLHEQMLPEVRRLEPFCENDFILFNDGGIHTKNGPDAVHATIEGIEFPEAAFNIKYLLPVLECCTHFDIDAAPKACAFTGPRGFEGRIVGVRF